MTCEHKQSTKTNICSQKEHHNTIVNTKSDQLGHVLHAKSKPVVALKYGILSSVFETMLPLILEQKQGKS
jgi:hypothetical protein